MSMSPQIQHEPSDRWTNGDRFSVATQISQRLHQLATEGSVDSNVILDYMERIVAVLTESPAFLEENRKHVLEGHIRSQIPNKIER